MAPSLIHSFQNASLCFLWPSLGLAGIRPDEAACHCRSLGGTNCQKLRCLLLFDEDASGGLFSGSVSSRMTTWLCLAESHLSISVWRAGMAPCPCLCGSTVPAAVHTPQSGLIFNGQSWWLLPGHPWGPLSCPVSLSSMEMSRLIHLLLCCSVSKAEKAVTREASIVHSLTVCPIITAKMEEVRLRPEIQNPVRGR